MDAAIVDVVLLLFVGGCIAVVVWSAKKQGWAKVLRYLLFTILIRIAMRTLLPDSKEDDSYLVPLLGAGVITLLWPHIAKQRMQEKMEETEPETDERPDSK
jgi:cyanate permease